jgi:hypothetical protein
VYTAGPRTHAGVAVNLGTDFGQGY